MNRVFTHRADRVAKAIERQGIRATYELHDRLLSNRASRGHFGEAPPQLDDLQRSILADVREQGYSLRSFSDLFTDPADWHGLEEQRDRFVASTEADLAAGGEHVRVRPGKEFVVRLQSYGVELGPDDPWFRVVSSHGACSTSRTRTSRCGRSSSTSTSGTRCPSRRRASASRRSAGTATTTTSTC